MSSPLRDRVAALAVGGTPFDEVPELVGMLAIDAKLRAWYRDCLGAADCVARAAEATPRELSDARKRTLRTRILAASLEPGRPAQAAAGYAAVVPHDRLVQFGDGIRWVVLPGQGMTTVYWVFEPPDCGDLPLESHIHEQAGFVLDGAFTLLYANGGARPLRTGDHYTIAPGTLHGATFESRTVLCDVYAPRREDFERLYAEQLEALRTG